MINILKRLSALEAKAAQSIYKPHPNWLCIRVPTEATESELARFREMAADQSKSLYFYSYDGAPNGDGESLPGLYETHELRLVPVEFAAQTVREARAQRS